MKAKKKKYLLLGEILLGREARIKQFRRTELPLVRFVPSQSYHHPRHDLGKEKSERKVRSGMEGKDKRVCVEEI